jgi:hypothetical protein
MKKQPESILACQCGQPLGEQQGNWIVYPNPTICPKCGKNNDEEVKAHTLAALMA